VTHQPAISFSNSFHSPFNHAGGRTSNVCNMKAMILLSTILVSLSPLSHGVEAVKISTTILTVPEGVDLPAQVRTVTMSEWRKILRTLSQIKGVPLFIAPAATSSSGKMTRVEIRSASQGFWRRDANPVFPISSIEYTPTATRGGIRLVGDFTMNRGATQSNSRSEIIKSAKVRGSIPQRLS
jgi:hypothetical protein